MSVKDDREVDFLEDNDWKADLAKRIIGVVLILSSMVGIYFGVDHSGWVLFAGIWLIL